MTTELVLTAAAIEQLSHRELILALTDARDRAIETYRAAKDALAEQVNEQTEAAMQAGRAHLASTENELAAAKLTPALAAYRAGDIDADGLRVRVAYRDLNSAGNGCQAYRRIVLPGRTESEWPDADRLPTLGGTYSGDRKCKSYALLPVGTLLISFESSVSKYRAGKSDLAVMIVSEGVDGKTELLPLEHKRLRSKPALKIPLLGIEIALQG